MRPPQMTSIRPLYSDPFQTWHTTFQGPEDKQNVAEGCTVYRILRVCVVCIWEPYHQQTSPVGMGFYLPQVSHTNPFPLLARIRRIWLRPSPSTAPLCSFSIPVYALPQLSPMQNRWYWVYVEVPSSLKLSSEVFLTGFHYSRHRCLWYDGRTRCNRAVVAPWLRQLTLLFCSIMYV